MENIFLRSLLLQKIKHPVEFELDSTTFEDGIFTIEGYGGGYDIYFELTIEGDILSGSLMGMFDVSGIRVKD